MHAPTTVVLRRNNEHRLLRGERPVRDILRHHRQRFGF